MGGKGDNLENQVKIFFSKLLNECGYTVIKNRKQKSGTQDGFDNEIILVDEFNIRHKIYLECKDYSTKLSYSEAIVKIPQIISSYKPDILIFISPKVPFSNPYNDTRLEEFYNEFNTPIEFLTPDNSIEELIAIDHDIYKNIYGEKPEFIVNRKEKINWFKKFIFSSKPLKKVVIKETERTTYITNISKIESYIERTITKASNTKKIRDLYSTKLKKSLIKVSKSFLNSEDTNNKGIVLLGNPGLGKSIELKNLATHYWENKEQIKWVPFYREIRTFTSTNQIEDYLPKNWKEIPQLLIILDGLDEVSYSQEFSSKLEKFLIDNSDSKNDIKFILSCRTNIYENTIKDITQFETYLLSNIYYYDAIKYLETNYELSKKDSLNLSFSANQKEFLENPYYLKIFGEYYKQKKKLPTSKSDLLNKFVEKRLEEDRIKFKNKTFDKSDVFECCKKVALSMEAMQINEIEKSKLRLLLNNNKNIFIDSSFSERVFGKENWKFEHRNLQEYFVAISLKELPFDEIINFIRLDEKTNKTHPSWLNSISYLLSILNKNSETYLQLIDWLKENEPEVLFKSDSDRIKIDTRFKIFKNYFIKRCKVETLWIRSYGSGILELSKFADCEDSVNFLIKEIKDNSNHRRTRISALDLLSNMEISYRQKEIKELIFFLLKEPVDRVDFRFKANVINQFKRLDFHLNSSYIDKLIRTMGDIDFHEITSAILHLIEETKVDKYSSYIKALAPKIVDESKRVYNQTDNLSTSEDSTLERILTKFRNTNNLIFALKFQLTNVYSISSRTKKEDIEKIINRLSESFFKEDSIFKKMLNFVDSEFYETNFAYEYEKSIFSFFEKTKTTNRAFNDLYNSKSNFDSKRKFLVLSANEENIKQIITDYNNNKLNSTSVIYFTNNLSHYNHNLAIKFETLVEKKTNIRYKKKLISNYKIEEWVSFHKNKFQLGFNLLFKKKELIKLVDDYFIFSKAKTITRKNNRENKKGFWSSLEHQLKFPQTFLAIVHDALSNNEMIKQEDVKTLILNDLFLLQKIKEEINSSHNTFFNISLTQKQFIEDWCGENLDKADFKNYTLNNKNHNKLRCNLLLFFRNKFNFKYPDKYLLDMLFMDDRIKFNEKELGYKYIIDSVDKKLIDERILFNLRSEKLNQSIYHNHINYCIENELKEAYPIIEEYLKNHTDRTYFMSTILYNYFEKSNRIEFVKDLVKPHPDDEQKDGLTWDAIKILIANQENEFVIKKLLEFRNLNKKNKELLIIIKFLIRANYSQGFNFFNQWLAKEKNKKKQIGDVISTDDYYFHTNKESIPYLIKLFKIGHKSEWDFDKIENPIRIARETLEVICRENGTDECISTINFLEKIRKEFEKKDVDLFYVNTLINDIKQQYNNHKSKPMTFMFINKKIEELKYHIV